MTLTDETRAEIIEMCAQAAVVAGELYGALLAVKVPDGAGRGITNFNGQQAFELTKTFLSHVVEGSGL